MSLAPNYTGPNREKYEGAEDVLAGIIGRFKDSMEDGFQISDLASWYGIVSDCYDAAKTIYGDGFTREELTDLVVWVYWRIDPNIPLIPELVEIPLEKKFIEGMAIPFAVGAAWNAVEKYIESKKED